MNMNTANTYRCDVDKNYILIIANGWHLKMYNIRHWLIQHCDRDTWEIINQSINQQANTPIIWNSEQYFKNMI